MDIYEYTDFNAWLNAALDHVKKEKSFASLRFVATRCGMDSGNLVRMKQGKVLPGKKTLVKLGEFFQLGSKGQRYLEQLVVLEKSKTDKEAWTHYKKLLTLKGTDVQNLEASEFEYFNEWYHATIRSMLNVVNIKNNYAALGKMLIPRISVEKVKSSIDVLEKLGMISRDDAGYWRAEEKFLGSGSKWKKRSIQLFQKQNLNLASDAIDIITPDKRDISTLTMSIPQHELPAFKEYIKEFKMGMMGLAQSFKEDDSVYQLNISLFPTAVSDEDVGDKRDKRSERSEGGES